MHATFWKLYLTEVQKLIAQGQEQDKFCVMSISAFVEKLEVLLHQPLIEKRAAPLRMLFCLNSAQACQNLSKLITRSSHRYPSHNLTRHSQRY